MTENDGPDREYGSKHPWDDVPVWMLALVLVIVLPIMGLVISVVKIIDMLKNQ